MRTEFKIVVPITQEEEIRKKLKIDKIEYTEHYFIETLEDLLECLNNRRLYIQLESEDENTKVYCLINQSNYKITYFKNFQNFYGFNFGYEKEECLTPFTANEIWKIIKIMFK